MSRQKGIFPDTTVGELFSIFLVLKRHGKRPYTIFNGTYANLAEKGYFAREK
jgi:hypothetical protein